METEKLVCKVCVEFVEPVYKHNGIHNGAWCPKCNNWLKWVSNEEMKNKDITIDPGNEPLF